MEKIHLCWKLLSIAKTFAFPLHLSVWGSMVVRTSVAIMLRTRTSNRKHRIVGSSKSFPKGSDAHLVYSSRSSTVSFLKRFWFRLLNLFQLAISSPYQNHNFIIQLLANHEIPAVSGEFGSGNSATLRFWRSTMIFCAPRRNQPNVTDLGFFGSGGLGYRKKRSVIKTPIDLYP